MSGITPLPIVEQQKPKILVTTGRIPGQTRTYTQRLYMEAIVKAGGLPILVNPYLPSALDALQEMDGLVLSGGNDMDPSSYGAERHAMTRNTSYQQDTFDIEAARTARINGVPILAICRGMQALNVAYGGTLHQDLPGLVAVEKGGIQHRHPKADPATTNHLIEIFDFPLVSNLGKFFAAQGAVKSGEVVELMVNSRHHQGVDKLGKGLSVRGRSADGVIEIIVGSGPVWELGIQFHAEEMDNMHVLFNFLVSKAAVQVHHLL